MTEHTLGAADQRAQEVVNRQQPAAETVPGPALISGTKRAPITPALDDERDRLLAEHGPLAVKKAQGALTPAEARRLRYVRWQLDRLDEAELAPDLDRLERLAHATERVARRVQALQAEVGVALRARAQPRRRSQG